MSLLYLDTETFSPLALTTHGTHRYAEEAEIIMWQYAIDDGPVIVEDYLTEELRALLQDDAHEIIIHNSHFDRTLIRMCAQIDIPTSRIFDTMVCALAHSLPGALDTLCDIFEIPSDKAKDKEGKKLIGLFCKLQKDRKGNVTRATKETHPAEWKRFCEYGRLDIEACRMLKKILPTWNYKGFEKEAWEWDQVVNDRGVTVDLDLANSAIRASTRAQREYKDQTAEMTEGEVTSTNRRDVLLKYILARYGIHFSDLTKATVKLALDNPDIPAELKELLYIRLDSSKTSVSKYKRVLNGVSEDGHLRGLLQFCGASRTGRWAGRLFQPQNLPRPTIDADELEHYIVDLKMNSEGL